MVTPLSRRAQCWSLVDFSKTHLSQTLLSIMCSRPQQSFIFLWSFGVSCPSCSLANFFCTSSLLAGQAECEEKEAFMLCEDCSAVSKTLVCYQFSYKSKADHHMACCEEN